jgi:chemotaxis methyl-accepting protein methylase
MKTSRDWRFRSLASAHRRGVGGVFKVSRRDAGRLRDGVFAPQNLLQNPPFSRLDIVTCRNLMIYLEPEMQQRVLQMLHFGLREGGTLMLGTSETIGRNEDLFEPIDKQARLFRRVGPTRQARSRRCRSPRSFCAA